MTIGDLESSATSPEGRRAPGGVVVVGGGAVGCAVARRLAGEGRRVVVVERGRPGSEATWAAGGMLAPLGEAPEPGPFLELALRSLDLYPEFVRELAEETGIDPGFRSCGKLLATFGEEGERRLRDRWRWQREAGFDVAWMDGDRAREIEPGLSPEVRAALHLPGDAVVNNRLLGEALWRGAETRGVVLYAGEEAAEVERADGAVRGVRLASGVRLPADVVVVAAGAWSGRLGGLPRELPVRPVRGQMLALAAEGPPIRGIVAGPGAYLIPRTAGPPRVVVGATEEEVGFRRGTTAPAQKRLLAAARELVPGLGRASVVERWHGFRPGTPDDLPVIGADPEVEGLIYATGHYRNGILLTPVTAELVSELVREGTAAGARDFGVGRFRSERALR